MDLVLSVEWRDITIGSILDFLFSGPRLEALAAWAAILGSLASIVGGGAAVVISILGFKLSNQTHALQKEAVAQRQSFETQQKAQFEERMRIEESSQRIARRTMVNAQAESDQQKARISAEHAWFEIQPVDALGQNWRITNVGREAATEISLIDDSSGGTGIWTLEDMGTFNLEAGKSETVTFFQMAQVEVCALVKLSWAEYPDGYFDYETASEEGEIGVDQEQEQQPEKEPFYWTQSIMIEFKFDEDAPDPLPSVPHVGVTGYPGHGY